MKIKPLLTLLLLSLVLIIPSVLSDDLSHGNISSTTNTSINKLENPEENHNNIILESKNELKEEILDWNYKKYDAFMSWIQIGITVIIFIISTAIAILGIFGINALKRKVMKDLKPMIEKEIKKEIELLKKQSLSSLDYENDYNTYEDKENGEQMPSGQQTLSGEERREAFEE